MRTVYWAVGNERWCVGHGSVRVPDAASKAEEYEAVGEAMPVRVRDAWRKSVGEYVLKVNLVRSPCVCPTQQPVISRE